MSSTSDAPSATSSAANVAGNFIGSKPSTVLFFIALCVGVIIAVLFIFFTFRYLVRSRFGLYSSAPQFARNPFYMGPTGRASMNGLQPYFEHDIALNLAGHRHLHGYRPRRREGYSRKRKLTQEEVDDLFPLKTYAKWLNGGQEDVINRNEGVLVYEEDAGHRNTPEEQDDFQDARSSPPEEVDLADQNKTDNIELSETVPATASSADAAQDLHFTSGMCAICLDNLLDDDEVRGLICGHVFHADCVDPWLVNRRGCCPMCKRDFFMRDQTRSRHTNEAQGDRSLDSIFNDAESVSDLFFPRSTKFKAQTLLASLQLVRNGEYATEGQTSAATAPPTGPIEEVTPMHNSDFNRPPMPELRSLQSSIMEIVNERPFHPDDLRDIDTLAFQTVNDKFTMLSAIFWRIMGIRKEDLYYHYVLVFYERNRSARLSSRPGGEPEQPQQPEQMV
ncbi:hypothetical protein HPODL_00787 [Ogataea parapolymorpha DL-1]|uniref:RING-type domain-containing protein n=1 Tax=Ogataea parapolymorpha (strain ATCC 26012 / BCRC 20466 / JCM 22074 / NRRL Y-7560 / DL-1) TaxID=871575 RepID=W1QID7_OGAPD|nr:hypothetical protein HPODL_00787 [Ogataea parapolymorpha DL-1]ESX01391.1 hypothetical protein HPODL_00787 [Ogataea parapolymorpha DL-1]